MNIPYLSLTLARRYVTEIVRSPRVTASLSASSSRPTGLGGSTKPTPSTPVAVRQQPAIHA